MTAAERNAKYEKTMRDHGFVRRQIWCKPEHADCLRDLADKLAENPKLLKQLEKLVNE